MSRPVGGYDKTAAISDQRIVARFLSKVIPEPNSGCWLWGAGGSGRHGAWAGQMQVGPITDYAHRISYRIYCGEVPAGLLVIRKCKVGECVNPDHLCLGTYKSMADARRARPDRLACRMCGVPMGALRPRGWICSTCEPLFVREATRKYQSSEDGYRKHRALAREFSRRQVRECSSRYVARFLRANFDQVEPELIEVKRLHLQIKRKLKEQGK